MSISDKWVIFSDSFFCQEEVFLKLVPLHLRMHTHLYSLFAKSCMQLELQGAMCFYKKIKIKQIKYLHATV